MMIKNYVSDVIFVRDSKSNESLDGVHPMSVTLHHPTKVVRHPVETGQVIMDNKVIVPSEITVSCFVIVKNYPEVKDMLMEYLDDTTGNMLCDIETKTDAYNNMMLYDLVEKQTKDKYDVVEIDLKFIQRMDARISALKNVSQASTNAMREQNKPSKDSGVVKTNQDNAISYIDRGVGFMIKSSLPAPINLLLGLKGLVFSAIQRYKSWNESEDAGKTSIVMESAHQFAENLIF